MATPVSVWLSNTYTFWFNITIIAIWSYSLFANDLYNLAPKLSVLNNNKSPVYALFNKPSSEMRWS
jgi:hypothetical protein